MIFQISIIASGLAYQRAAAFAAATYTLQLGNSAKVCVYLPESEKPSDFLSETGQRRNIELRHFEFRQVSRKKFTSQLKCQAFMQCLQDVGSDDLLFMVDADTYCMQPLNDLDHLRFELAGGKVGLVKDYLDHHTQDSNAPWFVPEKGRPAYVNSGVIATTRQALDIFQVVYDLSFRPEFLAGPFNDQKILNYVLGKFFPRRLFYLGKEFNGLLQWLDENTLIGHCAGGAGEFDNEQCVRRDFHEQRCRAVLAQFDKSLRKHSG